MTTLPLYARNTTERRYLNVYYRRTRRLDQPLITDIRLVPEPVPEDLKDDLSGWVKADGDVHSGVWPSQPEERLWYKLQDESKRQSAPSNDIVTEVDVVFGDDDPFYGFERIQGGPLLEAKSGTWETVDLAVRKGKPVVPKVSAPSFHSDGTLKILQSGSTTYIATSWR